MQAAKILQNTSKQSVQEPKFSKKFFSQEEDSPFAITLKEIQELDKTRPLGLSGHLRAKNEAATIGLAIETCLPALDELIITAQPSCDDTYEICLQKAQKYPDKIKLFYYTPEVVPVPYSHCAKKGAAIQNSNQFSIHNFAHYNNFGLTKISYKYYVKIDADQIYFTQKFQELKEAILAADKYTKPKRSVINKILGRLHRPFYRFLSSFLSMESFVAWTTRIEGRCAYGLCGINLVSPPKHNFMHKTIAGGGGQIFKCDSKVSLTSKAHLRWSCAA
ncbi:hypothetical protein BKH46_07745 [Helicobacter sp. 12S02634-8]|uniref:hypothetical protein n=1 Tax=Helicobacter sp. 12S02634-8 TaxID=1476199 RepID=UPI000BA5513A|nr:hypothetical protein [Helicobacter sp. 12S02634-8]PAF46353.1 hypothetical protein BKH46_07745 [Helicobacter sp. 12S02634-8]